MNSWDAQNRVANNEDTDDIKMAADVYTIDLQREEVKATENDDDVDSMTTKARREMRRMLDNDDETIRSISQEKQIQARPSAIEIRDDSSHGGVSAVSGASSRTSVLRAKLQQEFNEKMEAQQALVRRLQQEKNEQAQQFAQLAAQLARLQASIDSSHSVSPRTQATAPPSFSESLLPAAAPAPTHDQSISPTTSHTADDKAQDDATDDVDFDTSATDANHEAVVTDIENRIISHLDHDPTTEEMIAIRIEANRIASVRESEPLMEEDLMTLKSSESDDIKCPVHSQMMRSFPDSDDASSHDAPSERKKRLAVAASDDAFDSGQHFEASAPSSPKKKLHATGGRPPGANG